MWVANFVVEAKSYYVCGLTTFQDHEWVGHVQHDWGGRCFYRLVKVSHEGF